jgi:hypothetical protein
MWVPWLAVDESVEVANGRLMALQFAKSVIG